MPAGDTGGPLAGRRAKVGRGHQRATDLRSGKCRIQTGERGEGGTFPPQKLCQHAKKHRPRLAQRPRRKAHGQPMGRSEDPAENTHSLRLGAAPEAAGCSLRSRRPWQRTQPASQGECGIPLFGRRETGKCGKTRAAQRSDKGKEIQSATAAPPLPRKPAQIERRGTLFRPPLFIR